MESEMKIVTPEENLTRRAEWVMQRNVRLLKENGYQNADFYFGKGDGDLLYNLRLEKLAHWMNSGTMKEMLFAIIRHLIEEGGYDCFVMASDTWAFEANQLFKDLSGDLKDKLSGARSIQELVELGYGARIEAISVTAQTAGLAYVAQTPYYRDPINPDRVVRIGKTDGSLGELLSLGGRLKMFGPMTEPGMPEAYKKVRSLIPEFKKRGLDLPGAAHLVNIATEAP
jgi:hypothetical protein